ncbi:MAG: PHP domain-containing protein [Candidatus Aenigmarchaeota archaeon]|nr:PHP domain-containing protein [Candidatus Aenigmarchaeota archaeon]
MLCELHCHSRYSDGLPTVEAILRQASKKVQALAITDHNTLAGYEHAKRLNLNNNLLLIPGVEITATKLDEGKPTPTNYAHAFTHKSSNRLCHVLALGIQELKKGIALSSVTEIIDYIHSQAGIAIAAHPFRQRQNIDVNKAKLFDALEVINGNTFKEGNKKAKELALQLKIPMTSGSDAHLAIDVGKFAFQIEGSTTDEILKNIKKGRAVLPAVIPSRLHLFTRKTGGKAYRKISSYKRNY